MSQCGDYEDVIFYVINVFYGIVIAVYFLPFKKNNPVFFKMPKKCKIFTIKNVAYVIHLHSGNKCSKVRVDSSVFDPQVSCFFFSKLMPTDF